MNKRQAKKWRKKHFVTVTIPVFSSSTINGNLRSYSPSMYDQLMYHMTVLKQPSLKIIYNDMEDKDDK